jgi:hypothetical protein
LQVQNHENRKIAHESGMAGGEGEEFILWRENNGGFINVFK